MRDRDAAAAPRGRRGARVLAALAAGVLGWAGAAGRPAAPHATGAPLAPISVSGDRFVCGGAPCFPTTNFLTAGVPRAHLTHTYLADEVGDAERARMRETLRSEGYDAIFVYLWNEGDYGSRTTPWAGEGPGGAFDEAKLGRWRRELEALVAAGLRPVLWLVADDSPAIHRAPAETLERYLAEMVARFGDLPVLWVLALEVDEYWSRAFADRLGRFLAALTPHPVGVHQKPGRFAYMTADWVDFGAYQYARPRPLRDTDWEAVYAETLRRRRDLGGRPLLAAEYAWSVGGRTAAGRGLAAAFAGAAGVGNGAPRELASWLARAPQAREPLRAGYRLVLRGPGDLRLVADPWSGTVRCEGCD